MKRRPRRGRSGTVALRPIAGEAPERDVFALLPPGGRHPLAEAAVAALAAIAGERGWATT